MSNYIVTTNFAAKDALPSGNAAKVIKGADVSAELNNIATAIATKQDVSSLGVANGYAPLDSSAQVPIANQHSTTAYLDGGNQTFSKGMSFATAGPGNNALYVTGVGGAGSYAANILGDTTSGGSYGLRIQAGTTNGDAPLAIANAAATATIFAVFGNGNLTAGNGGGSLFQWTGGNASFAGALSVGGGIVGANNIQAGGTFIGSGANLTSIPAGQLTGTVPISTLTPGGGTAGSTQYLFANSGTPQWATVTFSTIGGTIANGQLPVAAIAQYANAAEFVNISSHGGHAKTLSHSAPSGGVDGDIWYVY